MKKLSPFELLLEVKKQMELKADDILFSGLKTQWKKLEEDFQFNNQKQLLEILATLKKTNSFLAQRDKNKEVIEN